MRFVACFLSISLLAAPPAAVNSEQIQKIPQRMKAFVDKGAVAGTVTLFARDGQIVEFDAVGYQDIETRKPMAKNSIFQIMSMTKPMVGTAIMMLAEEGKLAVGDPAEKYLPEFRGQMMIAKVNEDGSRVVKKPSRPITIRDLMSHTSGLPYNPPAGLLELPQRMDRTLADAVLVYSQIPLMFEPGTKWSYSNIGIATLGRIIEVTSGMSFEQFMTTRLWQPLEMKDTFLFPPDDKKARICAVHATGKDGKLTRADGSILGGDALAYRPGAKYPAPEWGAYTTAEDLFAFYQMLLDGGVRKGRRIMSRESIDVMTSLHTGDIHSGHMQGTGFGLTWEVVKEPIGELNFLPIGTFGHGGAFGTHGWVDRKHKTVGVFMVQGGAAAADVKYAFMRMANAALE